MLIQAERAATRWRAAMEGGNEDADVKSCVIHPSSSLASRIRASGILDALRPLDRLADVSGQRLAPSVIYGLANESDGVRVVAPDRNRSRHA
jgi:hypothetical protein